MTALAIAHSPSSGGPIALPSPRVPIGIRQAVASDIAFIDGLQRKHSRMVGWFPTKQIEAYIARGHMLIAEALSRPLGSDLGASDAPSASLPHGRGSEGGALGYVIARDQYFKRDDCGIVYQLNVVPSKQRGYVGGALIKAVFERAAYGCKLFCCWCAQDLEANHFWESLGFVPLAFRTGSRIAGQKKTPRIHIFWQRRIREGDTDTPYWFPAETTGGAVKENRLVLPIPPGTHWSDAKPAILPGMEGLHRPQPTLLPEAAAPKKPRIKKQPKAVIPAKSIMSGGLRFAPPIEPKCGGVQKVKEPKPPRNPRRAKNDPKYVAAARELRDRYLEQMNSERMLPSAWGGGKYDVSRQLEAAPSTLKQTPLLKAA